MSYLSGQSCKRIGCNLSSEGRLSRVLSVKRVPSVILVSSVVKHLSVISVASVVKKIDLSLNTFLSCVLSFIYTFIVPANQPNKNHSSYRFSEIYSKFLFGIKLKLIFVFTMVSFIESNFW